MSELQDMLRVQTRLHRKQGANALGDLFENASKEIEQLTEQLAKANERVKELEKELKESEDDLDAAEHQLSSYENALEEVKAVFVDSDACPLFEPFNPRNLSAWLNKFALEKRVEGAYAVISLLDETKDSKAILMANKYVREQLRKEQDHEKT